MEGIPVRGVDVELKFDRPTPLRPMAAAAVRGLLGHVLSAQQPEYIRRWFKPGQGNNRPSACVFHPVDPVFRVASEYAFRIYAWDPPGDFLPAIIGALPAAQGRCFGESGARVCGFTYSSIKEISSGHVRPLSGPVRIQLATPVRIKSANGWTSERDMSLLHLVQAAVRRFNLLSEFYGNGQFLDLSPWIDLATNAIEAQRELHWVRPRRRSSTQETDLSLSGVVGDFVLDSIPPSVIELLCAAIPLHLGQKTVEGCGSIRVTAA